MEEFLRVEAFPRPAQISIQQTVDDYMHRGDSSLPRVYLAEGWQKLEIPHRRCGKSVNSVVVHQVSGGRGQKVGHADNHKNLTLVSFREIQDDRLKD